MPKEINFILIKEQEYFDKYQWIFMSYLEESFEAYQQKEQEKEQKVKQEQKKKVESSQKALKSILKKKEQDNPQIQQNIGNNQVEEEEEQIQKILPRPFQHDENQNKNIRNIPEELQYEKVYESSSSSFSFKHHPILELSHIQGFTFTVQNLCPFGKNAIAYSSGSTIILQDLKTREQKYFFSSQKTDIMQISSLFSQNMIIACDQTQISYWNADTQQKVGFYYTGLNNIVSQDSSYCKGDIYVCIVGKDQQNPNNKNQQIIIIKNDSIISKVASTANITKIQFIDKKDIQKGIISVGKENIRFWNLKGTILSHFSVFLGEHARDSIFSDFIIFQEKALVVNNKGNLHIIDINSREIVGVFLIHQEPIKSIGFYNNENEENIITSGNNGIVKVWKSDFTEIILEVKLESQVEKICTNNYIVCGCLNGTIGVLNVEKKKFAYITRSHNEKILQLKYHRGAKKIITISEDYSIKIWDLLKLKSNNNIFIQQVYEFKCLDEQVCSLVPFWNLQYFLCGFESGNVRVFDIKNFTVLRDFDFHKHKITCLDVSNQDKLFLTSDGYKLSFFNQQFECVKEMQCKGNNHFYQVQFDLLGEVFSIVNQGNLQLSVYSINTFSVLFTINCQEEIYKVSFSFIKEDLFITTNKGKLKKFKIKNNFKEVVLFREYQNNFIANNFTISENCSFVFTICNANNRTFLKVYDYYFRGGLEPYFQAFDCGQQIQDVICSNDELNLVFAFSNQNRSLYFLKFYGNNITDRPLEEEEQKPLLQEENEEKLLFQPVFDPNKMNDRLVLQNSLNNNNNKNNQNINKNNQENKQKQQNNNNDNKQGNIQIKGLYDDINDQMQQYQQQYQKQKQEPPKQSEEKQLKQKSYQDQYNNENDLQQSSPNKQQPQQIQQNQQFKTAQMLKNEEQSINQNLQRIPEELEGQNLFEAKPIEIFQVHSTIGFSTAFKHPLPHFIWNKQRKYLITYVDNILTINDINTQQKQQKVTIFPERINSINISPNCKFYYVSFNSQTSIFDCISHQLITQINTENVSQLEISPCSNYLLTSQTQKNTLNVYELASKKLISSSILEKGFVSFKWNNVSLGTLEFSVLYQQKLQLWRLNSRMTLEYQEPEIKNKQQLGNFTCLQYFTFDNQHLLLIGTTQGNILIFDIRSGILNCVCQGVINQSISECIVIADCLVLMSNSVNVYKFDLKKEINRNNFPLIEKIAHVIEGNPEVLTLDALPVAYSSSGFQNINGKITENEENIIVLSKFGTLWLLDFYENALVRISGSHQQEKSIKQIHYLPQNNQYNGYIFSCSNDQSIRVWELDSIEQKTEFFLPKKECFCIDFLPFFNLLVGGYNDGFLRFFDYVTYEILGQAFLGTGEGQENIQVNALRCIPGTRNVIAGNSLGNLYIVFIENFENFSVQINKIGDCLGFELYNLDLNPFEPLNVFAVSTKNGKIQVWNRKQLKRNVKAVDELAKIYELEYYLIDNLKINKQQQSNLNFDNQVLFSRQEQEQIYYLTKDFIQIRNFREHINMKQIALNGIPKKACLNNKGDIIFVAYKNDGIICAYDIHNCIELDKFQVYQQISDMYLYDQQEQIIQNLQIQYQQNNNYKKQPYLIIATGNQIVILNLNNI